MPLEKKGMTSSFTILTCIMTGGLFPVLGSFFAYGTGAIENFSDMYWTGLLLTSVGGFLAHYLLSHTIHDLYHYEIEERMTLSKKKLIILLSASLIILLSIAIYLTLAAGWPVMVFSVIGAIVCLYAEGLIHSEFQMAFGAMFLVIGSFYVQVGYYHHAMNAFFEISGMIWLRLIFLSLFAFFSQYGWLLFYRLDDYGWSPKVKNKSILITKIGLPFLILALALPA
ncbi:MAG: hypothetical protein U9O96_08755 [Candidatus Thermoplasmatota archaeon]|nr:hypothetical protein [Candidatus Thermoplasmatota archaeon]